MALTVEQRNKIIALAIKHAKEGKSIFPKKGEKPDSNSGTNPPPNPQPDKK